MALLNHYDFEHLKNETEILVFEELERQLETYEENICLCNDCVVDMAAMVLNIVKPLYRHSLLGTLYVAQAMKDDDYNTSIKEAVSKAIEKIRQNPSHE